MIASTGPRGMREGGAGSLPLALVSFLGIKKLHSMKEEARIMEIFVRLNGLEGLPRILDEIWHSCLNNQPDNNEQRRIEEALKSIEKGMFSLQEILQEMLNKR